MLGRNIGVDLGTASVIIYMEGRGIVLTEPSVVAYNTKTGRMCAVGKKAYEMLGRNPDSIRVIRPMKDGVVSDFTATRQMLSRFLTKVCRNAIFKPNIIVCMPSSITNLERRTILDMITAAGAGKACLIEEPLAAAIGAGSDLTHAKGSMVVDIGGGTTDIAVITMGSIAVSKSIKVAGNLMDEAIVRQVRRERDIVIGERTAEEIKKQIGCAVLPEAELAMTVKGKRYISGMPAMVEITSTFIIGPQMHILLRSRFCFSPTKGITKGFRGSSPNITIGPKCTTGQTKVNSLIGNAFNKFAFCQLIGISFSGYHILTCYLILHVCPQRVGKSNFQCIV